MWFRPLLNVALAYIASYLPINANYQTPNLNCRQIEVVHFVGRTGFAENWANWAFFFSRKEDIDSFAPSYSIPVSQIPSNPIEQEEEVCLSTVKRRRRRKRVRFD